MAAGRALPEHTLIDPAQIRASLESMPGKKDTRRRVSLGRRVVNVPRSLRTYELRWRRSGSMVSTRAWMSGSVFVTAVYLPLLVLPVFSSLFIHDGDLTAEALFAKMFNLTRPSLRYLGYMAVMTFFFIIYAPSAGMVRLFCNPDGSIDGRFRFWGILTVRSDRISNPVLMFAKTVGDSSRITTAERYSMFLCDRDGRKAVLLARSRDAAHIADCYARLPEEIRSSAPCVAATEPVEHFGSGNWH